MMKKLAGLVILSAILLLAVSVCSAESGLKFYWKGNTYTAEEAAASDVVLPFKVILSGGATGLYDDASGIKAAVRVNTLDEAALQGLREYYNDSKSTDDQLFDKYVKLQRSYIPAMQDLFSASFLYGDQGRPLSESNMKLFYEGTDKIFGQESAVYLYNIFKADGLQFNEETHLDMSIPSMQAHSLINIGIVVRTGCLGDETIRKITALLGTIRPANLPRQSGALRVFGEKSALDAANAGIYPAGTAGEAERSELVDRQAGYSLSYPQGFVPYMRNGLGGRLQYRSYKINPNHIFSVSSEPLEPGTGPEKGLEKVAALEGADGITSEGIREIGGRDFYGVKYDLAANSGVLHIIDYFTADNSTLYTLRLASRLEEPSPRILEEFDRILASFKAMKPEAENPQAVPGLKEYMNNEEGYAFGYPEDWQLTDISENISYDRLRLVFPELSGPLDVTVAEGMLAKEITPRELPSCITGETDKEADSNVISYEPPYGDSSVKILTLSYRLEGSAIYVYRLADYLDSSGRNRLAYCTDIIKGKKIYSMFISISEYAAENGRIKNPDIDAAVGAIASSFRIVDTPEAMARAAAGEIRNSKVVFVEEQLKEKVDPALAVTSVENTTTSGSIYVRVANVGENSYYRVLPDFDKGSLQILEITQADTILQSELDKLKDAYKNRIVTKTYTNEADMTIGIDSRKDSGSPVFMRTYRVAVSFTDEGIGWKVVRLNRAEELTTECAMFLHGFFTSDIFMQFDRDYVFKDIDEYTESNAPYYAFAHIDSGDAEGFVILKIDPPDDNIEFISYRPVDLLLKDMDEKFGYSRRGYAVTASAFDGASFTLKLTLRSAADGSTKSENVKILYDSRNRGIDYKVR